jgi:hypothetical protein
VQADPVAWLEGTVIAASDARTPVGFILPKPTG